MIPGQMMFGGGVYVPPVKPRKGAIGKVERFIEERPWLTCGEIADAVSEPSGRVSEVLNKLKHEGKAQAQQGLGERRKWLWAGTSEERREDRDALLREAIATSDARMAEQMAVRLPKAFLRAGARDEAVFA